MTKDLELKPIIDQLARYGMPVEFLRYVDKNIVVEKGSTNQDELSGFWSNLTLKLSPEALDSLQGTFSPDPKLVNNGSIQTLYHEATHAYFHVRRNEPGIRVLLTSGEKWYKDAPLKYGETGDDPTRLFQEAAAEYVAHRVMAHWTTLQSMVFVRYGIRLRENLTLYKIAKIVKKADEIPSTYQQQTKQRVFGYEDEWRGCTRQQVQTTKQMPPRLREYCDKILLEGSIPDNFAQNRYLYSEYKKLLGEVAPLRVTPRASRGGGWIRAGLQFGCASGHSPSDLKTGCAVGRVPGAVDVKRTKF